MVVRTKLKGRAAIACAERAEKWLNGQVFPLPGTRLVGAVAALLLGCSMTRDIEALPSRADLMLDTRYERLEQFFENYHCLAPRHTREYIEAADRYGIDYRLLPAISVRETTCGLTQWRNNYWGYHPGRQPFQTVEEGIDFVARQLGEGGFYRGKNLEEKLFTYNPLPKYPKEVKSLMQEIEQ